jgi:SAM-dependent methyltransferase
LDVGCGTGALTAAILARCDPLLVVGADPSEDFITWARTHVNDDRARFVVGHTAELPPESADVVVCALVLNFIPDPGAALAEMRARAPDGVVVAAYVWDYGGRMELIRRFWDAAVDLDPAAAQVDEGVRFPLCRPAPLEALWREARFVDVVSRSIDVPTVFHDFDDFWEPFPRWPGPCARLRGDPRQPAPRRAAGPAPRQSSDCRGRHDLAGCPRLGGARSIRLTFVLSLPPTCSSRDEQLGGRRNALRATASQGRAHRCAPPDTATPTPRPCDGRPSVS